jgi:MerR family transcriptional regulator, light-induced transcriptional regulator
MMSSKDSEKKYPMAVVVRRTGLKPDLLRAWEKRYSAVLPSRSQGRNRMYSEEDIKRLLFLREAVLAGHRIGQIAGQSNEEIQELVGHSGAPPQQAPTGAHEDGVGAHFQACIVALEGLDPYALEAALEKAIVSVSRVKFIDGVLMPLLESVGDMWSQGDLRTAHEHMASAVVRSTLGRIQGAYQPLETDPCLLATTPSRQLHELGALAASIAAASEGWRTIYLGPNLPAEELAAAAKEYRAKVIALSLIYPPDDPRLAEELQLVRRNIPEDTRILAGGRSAPAYREALEAVGATILTDMQELRRELRSIRLKESPSR